MTASAPPPPRKSNEAARPGLAWPGSTSPSRARCRARTAVSSCLPLSSAIWTRCRPPCMHACMHPRDRPLTEGTPMTRGGRPISPPPTARRRPANPARDRGRAVAATAVHVTRASTPAQRLASPRSASYKRNQTRSGTGSLASVRPSRVASVPTVPLSDRWAPALAHVRPCPRARTATSCYPPFMVIPSCSNHRCVSAHRFQPLVNDVAAAVTACALVEFCVRSLQLFPARHRHGPARV
jgi:hypothetical protein